MALSESRQSFAEFLRKHIRDNDHGYWSLPPLSKEEFLEKSYRGVIGAIRLTRDFIQLWMECVSFREDFRYWLSLGSITPRHSVAHFKALHDQILISRDYAENFRACRCHKMVTSEWKRKILQTPKARQKA